MAQKREHTRHRARFHSPTGPRTRSTLGGDEARAARGRASPGTHTDSHGRCSRPAACPWTLLPRAPGALRASDARSADFITSSTAGLVGSGSGAPARVPPGHGSLGRAESTQGARMPSTRPQSASPPCPRSFCNPASLPSRASAPACQAKSRVRGSECFLCFKGLTVF